MSPTTKDYLAATSQLWTGKRTRNERLIASQRRKDVEPFIDLSPSLRILDLGNGRLRPQYEILNAEGHRAYGIDLVNGKKSGAVQRGYVLARWLFQRHLPGRNQRSRELRLVCGDARDLPFQSDTFDLVTSVAAFEHFLDVPAVVAEVRRVLRPGGVAWIAIHLFTSLSGGHNLSSTEIPLRHVPTGVDPWDHLRKRRLPFTVPLNEWRLPQYMEVFARHFEILKHYCTTREGEHLLTPEIEAELPDYSREELTCGTYVIIARKVLA